MVRESVLEELVMWHEAPMAAVTRAFGALGSLRLRGFLMMCSMG